MKSILVQYYYSRIVRLYREGSLESILATHVCKLYMYELVPCLSELDLSPRGEQGSSRCTHGSNVVPGAIMPQART
eukprot:COSAG01_NODE_57912_length_309_cov_0.976190_1_plen_75_part_10